MATDLEELILTMNNYLRVDIMLFKCHKLKYVMLLWKNKMAIDNSRALSNLRRGRKKMATIILAV